MTPNQFTALIWGIVLLLPGGYFLAFGMFGTQQSLTPGSDLASWIIGAVILSLAVLLFFCVAFRRWPPDDTGGPPQTPESPEN
jgi:uncharacterized BrkB/YihY/UPF0761 family membrane protein